MIGQKAQCEVYCKFLLQVNDENVMRQYNQSNFTYFKESMCNIIFHSVPKLAIYDLDGRHGGADRGRNKFLENNWQLLRDNINFTKEILSSPEDSAQMNVLRWLGIQGQEAADRRSHLET
jgi:hypothetical protein